MTRTLFHFVALGLCMVALWGCEDSPTSSPSSCISTVEQTAVLSNWASAANSRINAATQSLSAVDASVAALVASPSEATLADLRESFVTLQLSWAAAEPYVYGPDGASMQHERINTFPVDVAAVDAQLANGSIDIDAADDNARGLPALEYLLFGSSDEELLAAFSNGATGELADGVIAHVTAFAQQLNALAQVWQEGAGEFSQRSGTAAGDGLSVIINALSRHYEDARRDQLATPSGITTLGIPNPNTVQARFSNQSLALLTAAISANYDAFTQGAPSVRDFLEGLEDEQAKSLVTDIETSFTQTVAAAQAVASPLQEAVTSDADDVLELYRRMSTQVINLKTDVPAITCVAVTYVDNPSDSD